MVPTITSIMGFYLGYRYNMALLVNENQIADFWGQHPESHQMASWLPLKWLRYPEPTDSSWISKRYQFGETTNHIFARKIKAIKAMLLWSTSSFHSAGFDFLLVEEQTDGQTSRFAGPPLPGPTGLALDKVWWFSCCPRLNYHRCGKWMKMARLWITCKKCWFSTSVLVCHRVNMVRFHG